MRWTNGSSKWSNPDAEDRRWLIRYADDFVCAFQLRKDATRFYQAMPKRLEKFGLEVAPEKTRILRFSRFHPGLRRRFAFLGFELYWNRDRRGDLRVMKRTARKKLQGAKRRMKEWIKAKRHLPGRQFIKALNRKLVGHYNYYGVRSNETVPGQLLRLHDPMRLTNGSIDEAGSGAVSTGGSSKKR